MPDRSVELGPYDQQIGALLDVIGHVDRDPDPSGFGYTYRESIAEPLGHVASQLQIKHGLDRRQVFSRFLTASELAVVIRTRVESRLPDDHIIRRMS